MERDPRSLAKTTQNDVLWIHSLLYLLFNKGIYHFTTILHSFTIVVSLETPCRKVEPSMVQSTLTGSKRNLMSCDLENIRTNTCGTYKSCRG